MGWNSYKDMSCLVGRKIKLLAFTDDRQIFTVETDERPFHFQAEGDCCSFTWWDGVDDEQNLTGGTVTAVENIDMPDRPCKGCPAGPHEGKVPFRKYKPNNHDCVRYYGVKITTTKGISVVDFRNDSNGYYGGSYYLIRDISL